MSFTEDWVVHRYESVTSTMDQAAKLAEQGARDRTAVLSDEQSAGRGRGGRTWHSPRGAVYCTLIIRPAIPPDRVATLSLLTAVAVAEAIEATVGLPARLKWPNDVWLGDVSAGKKVAGILLSSKLAASGIEYVLAGIGVNVAMPPEALPPGATSLCAASGVPVQPAVVFATLLQRFDVAYAHVLASGGHPSLAGWRARAALLDQEVVIAEAGATSLGIFLGIDDDGALLLRTKDGHVRRIVAGDMVRGPRALQRY